MAITARMWSWTSAGLARAVDPPHQPLLVVVVDQRLGLLVVDAQPVADHVRLVVVALDQTRAVLIADALVLGRVELDVVVVAGLHAHPPAREPADDLLVGHVDQQRRGDPAAQLGQLLVERLGLLDRARKAVEDEAVLGVVLLQALGGHRDDQIVGHEVAGVHVALRLLAELGPFLDVRAQHVAGRDERQLEVGPQAIGLRPLARAGRAEQDQIELGHERSLYRLADRRGAIH